MLTVLQLRGWAAALPLLQQRAAKTDQGFASVARLRMVLQLGLMRMRAYLFKSSGERQWERGIVHDSA